jgi:hypothetical protein
MGTKEGIRQAKPMSKTIDFKMMPDPTTIENDEEIYPEECSCRENPFSKNGGRA